MLQDFILVLYMAVSHPVEVYPLWFFLHDWWEELTALGGILLLSFSRLLGMQHSFYE